MKILSGRELAGYIKERQAHAVRSLRAEKKIPKLVIIRDSENPIIMKYVGLKKHYGEDIGIPVIDIFADGLDEIKNAIQKANNDSEVSGIIVQLPLKNPDMTDEIVSLIAPAKDVDGLSGKGTFDSATATAINWLLNGYNIDLDNKKIAIVGRGRLVGMPLIHMWKNSGFDVTVFHRGSDFSELKNFDIIITATGNPHLITNEMISAGSVIVDAGTASESGVILGDINDEIRERSDIDAITPKIGGVGPLTVCVLFDDVIRATK